MVRAPQSSRYNLPPGSESSEPGFFIDWYVLVRVRVSMQMNTMFRVYLVHIIIRYTISIMSQQKEFGCRFAYAIYANRLAR